MGQRRGVTSDEKARMHELGRENRELRRANEILKAAASFFGAELDRQSKRSSRFGAMYATGGRASVPSEALFSRLYRWW
jgi:transposase-like protein